MVEVEVAGVLARSADCSGRLSAPPPPFPGKLSYYMIVMMMIVMVVIVMLMIVMLVEFLCLE